MEISKLSRIDSPFLDIKEDLLKCQETILGFAILCTDARVENPESPIADWHMIGKSLDVALVKEAAIKFGLKEFEIKKKVSIIDRLPFSSENKFSGVRIKQKNEESSLFIGAPEVILKMCHNFYWNDKKIISIAERKNILKSVQQDALSGFRIVSVAFSANATDLNNPKKNDKLLYLGNILLKDPVRKEVGWVISEIEKDGIKTIIMTGDHTGTAISVARELGMVIEKDSVLEQRELDLINDDELRSRLLKTKIFSRVTPQSKVRITKMFQSLGYVVAMTGDGVNDAPALKQADVGIAVGSGSEVARESADLILLDDSFNTIVSAIDEGRKILQNIRKVLVFCLIGLFDEVLLIGGAILLNISIPLTAAQILWVNFITDSLPAMSLSYEDEKQKGQAIRGKIHRESIFDNKVKFLVWVVGVITSLLLFFIYYFLLQFKVNIELARTFTFASFGIYTLFVVFSVRSLDKNIWEYNPFSNKFVNAGFIIGMFFMLVAVYNPIAQKLLGTTSLSLGWMSMVFGISFLCLFIMETGKYITRRWS
jgi:Ca2+-transporting ATPase